MNRALIQQVLDALEKLAEQSDCDIDPFTFGRYGGNLAIQALRAELAKPEPEPVAIYRFSHLLGEYGVKWMITSELPDGTLLYTKDQL